MDERTKGRIDGLRYAIDLCTTRQMSFKHAAYNAAFDEMRLFLEAAKERLEMGEEMNSTCVVT